MFRRALFGLFVTIGFGQQIDSNSITVAVSRYPAVQPDQIIFDVTVYSDIAATLSDVLPALQGVGITAENFTSVRTVITFPNNGPTMQSRLFWAFSLTVPLSKLKEESAALNAAMQTLQRQNSPLILLFGIGGTQASQALRDSHPCPRSDLIGDARVQAQKLADASGLTLGPILAITSVPPSCSMIVKFASPVSGQSDQNSLTVTATRSNNLQRDQVAFSLSVESAVVTGLDEAVAALQGSGITAADLSAVYGFPPTWTFTLVVPMTKMKDTNAALGLLQQRLSTSTPRLVLTFSANGPQAASQTSPSCSPADLVADARTEAQALAAASSHAVGQILGMSQSGMAGSGNVGYYTILDPFVAIPSGAMGASVTGFFTATSLINSFSTPPPTVNCSLTVKFRLIDNQ